MIVATNLMGFTPQSAKIYNCSFLKDYFCMQCSRVAICQFLHYNVVYDYFRQCFSRRLLLAEISRNENDFTK